jgi:hypothetical protein
MDDFKSQENSLKHLSKECPKINHRSKDYPNDKNKYKKVEIEGNTITSIPLPTFVPPIIQQVIDENIKPVDATNTD